MRANDRTSALRQISGAWRKPQSMFTLPCRVKPASCCMCCPVLPERAPLWNSGLPSEFTRQHPEAPQRDIDKNVHRPGRSWPEYRRSCGSTVWRNLLWDLQAIEQFQDNPKLSLRDLIIRIIDAEGPKSPMMPIELRFKILDVVDEVLDQEYLAGRRANKRFAPESSNVWIRLSGRHKPLECRFDIFCYRRKQNS